MEPPKLNHRQPSTVVVNRFELVTIPKQPPSDVLQDQQTFPTLKVKVSVVASRTINVLLRTRQNVVLLLELDKGRQQLLVHKHFSLEQRQYGIVCIRRRNLAQQRHFARFFPQRYLINHRDASRRTEAPKVVIHRVLCAELQASSCLPNAILDIPGHVESGLH